MMSFSLASTLGLSACTELSNWLQSKDKQNEEALAIQETPKAHPVGVAYDMMSSNGEKKQLSIFYNGEGLARILFRNSGNTKLLLDFNKQEITSKDFNTDWIETKKIDPYNYPIVLNAKNAAALKAECIGKGRRRGYPFHRWSLHKGDDEWEVWTDDNDSFPIYFRSIRNGEVTTWTMANAWIDGSTYDKPTFFTLEPDPLPPAPETKEPEEPIEPERKQHRKHSKHGPKKNNKIAES